MAKEDDDADAVGDDDEGDSGKASGGGGKKKIIIIIALAFLVVVGGVAGAYFMGLLDPVIERIVGPEDAAEGEDSGCLLDTSPSPRDATLSRMPSSA